MKPRACLSQVRGFAASSSVIAPVADLCHHFQRNASGSVVLGVLEEFQHDTTSAVSQGKHLEVSARLRMSLRVCTMNP